MEKPGIEYCTLAMFIIDEIHYPPPEPARENVVGGAGSYAAMGARLFAPPPLSTTVGWIVDCGSDFPQVVRSEIERWQTGCLFRENDKRLTTRAWIQYDADQNREFKYVTPRLRLDFTSLSAELLMATVFHTVSSPERCMEIAIGISKRKNERANGDGGRGVHGPIFVWEPVPDSCTPDQLDNLYRTATYVHVLSPNHFELCALFSVPVSRPDGALGRENIEECATALVRAGIGPAGGGAVVVRAGEDGCLVLDRQKKVWLPAYHANADDVKDPTGGGNAFLGGLSAGLIHTGKNSHEGYDIVEAAVWGSVAASFAIEQTGMPGLAQHNGSETWNGVQVSDRLNEYRRTCFNSSQ